MGMAAWLMLSGAQTSDEQAMAPNRPPQPHQPVLSRRPLLRAGGALAGVAVAGCLGGRGPAPEPVAVSGGLQCDVCGMIIEKHPGPNGQLFYREHDPEGHANPARFDSLKQCFFPYRLEHEQLGWSLAAAYVTDYSTVDFTLQAEGDTAFISSHPDAGAFAPAADLTYVVGSDVQGAMGPDFIPFSIRADAETFAASNGGDLVAYQDIDEGLVGR